ncbi:hypothetical protein AB5J49_30125 [Streptomyces sp. R28]|uniref:Uncharacterized protein n=1 Tax=Streptomyces sp. R28 TaxID=3238628 RepID=A0AB39Q767_9ACTN
MGGTAETSAETGASGEADQTVPRLFGPRGRHRRPRPRKVLLAAGGLALAAGALSLLRVAPDSEVAGLGATEADPATDAASDTYTDTDTDGSTNAAAALPTAAQQPSPSATSAMGGLGTTPTPGTIVVPTTNTTAAPPPGGRGATTDHTPPLTPTPHRPATTGNAPQPAPTPPPSRPTTNPPSPQPDHPDEDSVCVPIIGLCVDQLPNGD